jgi:hypothetical protein
MRSKLWILAPVAGALLAFGCSGTRDVQAQQSSVPAGGGGAADDDDDGDDEEEYEEDVDLAQVPESVKKAAQDAVPGLVLKSAEKELENGQVVYCLEGTAGGERVEVEVTTAGKVVEIERGDDEEDEEEE